MGSCTEKTHQLVIFVCVCVYHQENGANVQIVVINSKNNSNDVFDGIALIFSGAC